MISLTAIGQGEEKAFPEKDNVSSRYFEIRVFVDNLRNCAKYEHLIQNSSEKTEKLE